MGHVLNVNIGELLNIYLLQTLIDLKNTVTGIEL